MVSYKCRLQDILKIRGISQAELAKRTGFTPAMINMISKSKRVPTIHNAIVIAGALQCSIYDIWEVER